MNEDFVERQGRPRGAPRRRRRLHGRHHGAHRPGRLADDGVPHPRRPAVLRRHLLPAAAAARPASFRRCSRPSARRGASAATRRCGRPAASPRRSPAGPCRQGVGAAATATTCPAPCAPCRPRRTASTAASVARPKFPPSAVLAFLLRHGATDAETASQAGSRVPDAGGDGPLRHVRPAGRRLRALRRRRRLGGAALREDALRQRPAGPGLRALVAPHRLGDRVGGSPWRPATGSWPASAPTRAASPPRSTPTPRASRGSRTSGRRRSSTTCSARTTARWAAELLGVVPGGHLRARHLDPAAARDVWSERVTPPAGRACGRGSAAGRRGRSPAATTRWCRPGTGSPSRRSPRPGRCSTVPTWSRPRERWPTCCGAVHLDDHGRLARGSPATATGGAHGGRARGPTATSRRGCSSCAGVDGEPPGSTVALGCARPGARRVRRRRPAPCTTPRDAAVDPALGPVGRLADPTDNAYPFGRPRRPGRCSRRGAHRRDPLARSGRAGPGSPARSGGRRRGSAAGGSRSPRPLARRAA